MMVIDQIKRIITALTQHYDPKYESAEKRYARQMREIKQLEKERRG